jgi:hypothetical protein
MRSIVLWWCYIKLTITNLDIIHRPIPYLKRDVSMTGSLPSSDGIYCLPEMANLPIVYKWVGSTRRRRQKLVSETLLQIKGRWIIFRRMVSSGLLRRVALVRTDVSEEPGASFIRVTKIGELRATRRNNQEDTILHSHRRENLKS